VGEQLASTQWSLVLAAGRENEGRGAEALAQLCARYWAPVHWLIRREVGEAELAKDLTQEFFARLIDKQWLRMAQPERGRFRSFLFACVRHFLANERDRERALKRGGGQRVVSMDEPSEDGRPRFEPVELATPASEFEQRWALAVLETAMGRLQRAEVAAARGLRFEVLQPVLADDRPSCSYRELATRLAISEGAVKVEVHRLRHRFGAALRAEIGTTVADPEEVEDELRYLLAVLTRR